MSFDAAVEAFGRPLDGTTRDRGQAIHFCNAYSVSLAEKDRNFREVISRADVVCCDGVPITWAGRLFYSGQDLTWDRVYGPDVMSAILSRGAKDGAKHFLLGGSETTLAALLEAIIHRWPEVEIVGVDSPPFRDLTLDELAEQVHKVKGSGATHVWVGLGQPKQDYAAAYLASQLVAKFFAVGAAFDFHAGTKSQAPRFMQKSGTEWLYRFVSEPARLGRRYLFGNPIFLYSCLKHGRQPLVGE